MGNTFRLAAGGRWQCPGRSVRLWRSAYVSSLAASKRALDGDFTFITNNAADFRRLYAQQEFHAGLVIIFPQVDPARQRALFSGLLDTLDPNNALVNEVIEVSLNGEEVVLTRYDFPGADDVE